MILYISQELIQAQETLSHIDQTKFDFYSSLEM